MGSKIQNEGFKNSSEAGGDSRLTDDTKVYTQSKSKSLYQAIVDGDLGPKQNLVTNPAVAKSNELTAFYRFNQGLVNDEAGSYPLSNNGAVQGAGIFGEPQGSIYLNGSGAYLTNSSLFASATPTALAIDFWTKMNSGLPAIDGYLFYKTCVGSPLNRFYLGQSTGALYFGYAANGVVKWVTSTSTWPAGPTPWIHICVTVDTVNGMRMFINGVLEATDATATSMGAVGTYAPFTIGAYNHGTLSNYYGGLISNFRIQDKILSQADVTEDYNTISGTRTVAVAGNFTRHQELKTETYQLPTAITGSRLSFLHDANMYGVATVTPNIMKIMPASGDRIMIGNKIAEYPGNLSINKKGVQVDLMAIDATTWIVNKVVANDHLKNTTIGDGANISLVGRDSWITKAPNTGTVRHGLGGFSLNGYGYVCNGFDNTNNRSECDQYNDNTNTWISRAFAGSGRRYPTAFALNNYGYSCGGNVTPTDAYKYTDSSNTWVSVAPLSSGKALPTSHVLNGYGYVTFGNTGSAAASVHAYNDTLNSWAAKSSGITARDAGASFVLNGFAYVCDGEPNSGVLSSVEQYNDSGDFWLSKSTGGTARYGLSGFSISGYGFICTGLFSSTNSNEVNQYNDTLNIWINKASTSTAKYYNAGLSLQGYGYICNGLINGGSILSEVNQYN